MLQGSLFRDELAATWQLFVPSEFKLADTPAVVRLDFAIKIPLEIFIA